MLDTNPGAEANSTENPPVDSQKTFNDSFGHEFPSLWLAVWDTALSLRESLEYGYTRLQLLDAAATSSLNLGLVRQELPGRKPAYDYKVDVVTSGRQMQLTCDRSDENYGPCRITLLVQYPNFHRDIMTHKKGMERWVSTWFWFTSPRILIRSPVQPARMLTLAQ